MIPTEGYPIIPTSGEIDFLVGGSYGCFNGQMNIALNINYSCVHVIFTNYNGDFYLSYHQHIKKGNATIFTVFYFPEI